MLNNQRYFDRKTENNQQELFRALEMMKPGEAFLRREK